MIASAQLCLCLSHASPLNTQAPRGPRQNKMEQEGNADQSPRQRRDLDERLERCAGGRGRGHPAGGVDRVPEDRHLPETRSSPQTWATDLGLCKPIIPVVKAPELTPILSSVGEPSGRGVCRMAWRMRVARERQSLTCCSASVAGQHSQQH
eukprot:3939745-Rhodomonas_salina.1